MPRPKITSSPAVPPFHGRIWKVKYDEGCYLTESWYDAVRYALCSVKDGGPYQIPLPPEPPRDRVIEARDEEGEVIGRWKFSPSVVTDDWWWTDDVDLVGQWSWLQIMAVACQDKWQLWSVPAEGGDR